MKKKILALLIAAGMIMTAAGCDGGDSISSFLPGENNPVSDDVTDSYDDENPVIDVNDGINKYGRATMLSLAENGLLNISRRNREENVPMGDSGTWAFYVYMCGTDLETDYASGTSDLQEMLSASASENVIFVVQTGGAKTWQNDMVSHDKTQRFIITEGQAYLSEELPAQNMGDSDTLADFLSWSIEKYPAEHMNAVLWNHGGGSITGVCFDELSNYDSLSLTEIESAFESIDSKMTCKFESVIFDACLMATVETANILVPYANYMLASQEFVSGCGLNYTAIGNAADKNTDYKTFAKAVMDAHYKDCAVYGEENSVAFSCIDLSKIDPLLTAFDMWAKDLYEKTDSDDIMLSSVTRSIISARNYGGNNRNEGYTNMVDMGDMVKSVSENISSADKVLSALQDCVIASKRGSDANESTGLSIYYPLNVQGSQELGIFKNIAIDPYYLSFVDRAAYGSVNSGDVYSYDDTLWLGDDSFFWGDYTNGSYISEWNDSGYYGYDDSYSFESNYYNTDENNCGITLAVEPQFDEYGYYWTQVAENSLYNLYSADCSLLLEWNDGGEYKLIDLGTDIDTAVDWDTGVIMDNFEGKWFYLPDGQPLTVFVLEETAEYCVYSSPIMLNGAETNLRIYLDENGLSVMGVCGGVNDYGAASRIDVQLAPGDKITPLYPVYTEYSYESEYYYGEDYVCGDAIEIYWDLLSDGTYYYAFELMDIYGSYLLSDYATFIIENGEIFYDNGEYGDYSDDWYNDNSADDWYDNNADSSTASDDWYNNSADDSTNDDWYDDSADDESDDSDDESSDPTDDYDYYEDFLFDFESYLDYYLSDYEDYSEFVDSFESDFGSLDGFINGFYEEYEDYEDYSGYISDFSGQFGSFDDFLNTYGGYIKDYYSY